MKLYIYDIDSTEHIATIIAENNESCEEIANDRFGDEYGWTYSPAFGFENGIIENDDAEIIEA